MFASMICLLMIFISDDAFGVTIVDQTDSQSEYGKQVAALSRKVSNQKRGAEQILVLMKSDGTKIDFSEIDAEVCISGPSNRFTLQFSEQDAAEKAITLLNNNEHILYAEKDQEVIACDTATEDDIDFESYGAEKMGFQSLLSWTRKENRNITVAVIDSGIGVHPLLDSRTVNGWDYVDNDNDPTNDEYGHGTHVAGIVADCTKGLAVSLYAVRILDVNGRGKASNAANGVLEAAEKGIPVVNLSFAVPGDSEVLDDAVISAISKGCTIVAAAGNYGQDASKYCPAHLTIPGIIVVGSVAENGERANYSNYGYSVDCYAYGSGIRSCKPGGGVATRSGTSQAAPHITAACAMLKILYSGSPSSIERRVKSLLLEEENELIPRMDTVVPRLIPCHLENLVLGMGEHLMLPAAALPARSNQPIQWTSADETVLQVSEGSRITAVSPGQTVLVRSCSNFDDAYIHVTVSASASRILRLPESLVTMETEAFQGVSSRYLLAGDQLKNAGEDSFEKDTVILCPLESPIAGVAEEQHWHYIAH